MICRSAFRGSDNAVSPPRSYVDRLSEEATMPCPYLLEFVPAA
ncbi:hypothetical protein QT971_20175 [Microcoleus sp. herbarium19]